MSKDKKNFLELPAHDLNIYFSETYLKVRTNKDKAYDPCYMMGFHGENLTSYVELRKHGRGILEIPFEELDFDFSFPNTGLYNFKQTVLWMYRKTDRQNKKGMCSGTFGFIALHEKMRQFAIIPDLFRMANGWSWNLANVQALFSEKEYPDLQGAVTQIMEKQVLARAISSNFAITQGIESNLPALWRNTTYIGQIVNKDAVKVKNKLFFQEVKDFFNKKDISVYV